MQEILNQDIAADVLVDLIVAAYVEIGSEYILIGLTKGNAQPAIADVSNWFVRKPIVDGDLFSGEKQ